mmetsp:Transcript_5316/g.7920  ORF Transcript_5316/g.7920 Transcript_5316/m.7920 type:complete len:81 (-) Transcript_5316:333-575(-)
MMGSKESQMPDNNEVEDGFIERGLKGTPATTGNMQSEQQKCPDGWDMKFDDINLDLFIHPDKLHPYNLDIPIVSAEASRR